MKMQTTTITRGAIICRDSESGSLASGGGVVVRKRKREGATIRDGNGSGGVKIRSQSHP
jgi:hypothetical protein